MSEQQNQTENRGGRGKRRWLRIVLSLLVLLAVLVALGPTIISTAPVRRVVLEQVNSRINGRLSVESWSIGWFSGVNLKNVSLQDNQSQAVLDVQSASLQPSYSSLLGANPDLGKIIVQTLRLEIHVDQEGRTNLEDILRPAEPGKPSGKRAKFELQIKDGTVVIHHPQAGTVSLDELQSNLQMPAGNGPVKFELRCALSGQAGRGQIQANGSIPRSSDGDIVSEQITLHAKVNLDNLDLRMLQPLLRMADWDLQLVGLINVNAEGDVRTLHTIELSGEVRSPEIIISGQALKADQLHIPNFQANIQARLGDNQLDLEKLDMLCDLAAAKAKGKIYLRSKSEKEILGSTLLQGQLTANLSDILNQLPATLSLRKDLKVTGGTITANYTIISSRDTTEFLGTAAVSDLQGNLADRAVRLDAPVEFNFDLAGSKQELQIRQASVSSSFGNCTAKGTPDALAFQGQIELDKLTEEAAKFIDLAPLRFAGHVLCDGNISSKDRRIDFGVNLAASDLLISGLGRGDLREPSVKLNAKGSLAKTQQGRISAVIINQAAIVSDLLRADLSGRADLEPLSANANVQFQADLAKLARWLTVFERLDPKTELAGQLQGSARYSESAGEKKLMVDSKASDLHLRFPGKFAITKQEAALFIEGSVRPASEKIELLGFNLTSSIITAKSYRSSEPGGPEGQDGVSVQVNCNLERLSKAIESWPKSWPKLRDTATAELHLSSLPYKGTLSQRLASPDLSGQVAFDQQQFFGLTIGPGKIGLQLNKGLLKISRSTIDVNTGKMNLQALVNPFQKNDKPFLTITEPIKLLENVQINPEVSERLLKFINPIFANTHEVSGTASFDCQHLLINQPRNWSRNAEIRGLFSSKNLRIQSRAGLIKDLTGALGLDLGAKVGEVKPISIQLADEKVSYRDMHIVFGPLLDLSFSGQVGLDETINMRLGLPIVPAMVGNNPKWIKLLGDQRIYVPITGTINKPRLDLQAIPALVKQELTKALEKTIQDITTPKEGSKQIEDLLQDLLKFKPLPEIPELQP